MGIYPPTLRAESFKNNGSPSSLFHKSPPRTFVENLAVLFLAILLAAQARAATDVYIKVGGQGGANLLPLALPPFIAQDSEKSDDALLATRARDIVRADLMFSRYFSLLENGS